ncbi:MAG TPA: HAD family phosphatase [Reyranella sp.]|jgi:HAD superfamily hydrolase (TIGR01509 family)|nr:HAD family phosphatase [Reyranella sp.]
MLPRPVKAVVFDMDGLLFDTERLYEKAFFSAALELGHEASHDVFRLLVGAPWVVGRRTLLEHYGADFRVDELSGVWMRHFRNLVEVDLPVKPGALELLTLLDELGLPRAIATSSSHKTVQHHLALHKLAERFHAVVAEGDYAKGKPAPDPFLMAAAKLGVDPADCLALEDSFHGIRAAHGAGMMAVMVPDMLQPTEEIRALCHVVSSLHEVCGLISRP